MAIMTTVGIGTPVLGELASDLLGIPIFTGHGMLLLHLCVGFG